MRQESVSQLRLRAASFDFFQVDEVPDSGLIGRDLYLPLPVWRDSLVWGFSILKIAEEQGKKSLRCQEVKGNFADMLVLALTLENRIAKYSWGEKKALCVFIEQNKITTRLDEIALLVSGTPNFFTHMKTFQLLPEPVQELVARSRIDLKTANTIKKLPEQVIWKVGQLQSLSFSELRIFAADLVQVVAKSQLGAEEILLLFDRAVDSGEPETYLKRKSHPQLSEMQSRYREIVEKALFKTGIDLKAPTFFEGDTFAVSFSFRDKNQLIKRIGNLKKLIGECDELFTLLQ